MKLPRYSATTTPPRISGAARATNINALVRTSDIERWQAVGALGQSLDFAGQLALSASQHRRVLDDKIEEGKAIQNIKDVADLLTKTRGNYDPAKDQLLPGDSGYRKQGPTFFTDKKDELDEEDRKTFLKDTDEIIRGIRSAKVKANIQSWRDKNILALLEPASSAGRRILQDYHVTEIHKLMVAAAENGDIDTANEYADLMDDNQLITHGKAEVLKKSNKIIADTSITYYSAKAVMADKGHAEAIKHIMAQDIDVEIKKDIVSKINFEAAQLQDRLEIAREQSRDIISKLIRAGKSATEEIEISPLDEKEQWTWFERERAEAERRAKDEPIATNYLVKGEVEAMAYDISTGVVTMPEFKKRLVEERYTNKTLDDAAYDELISLAERKFESYQAQAMKERELHALGQLVTHPSELGFAEQLRQLTSMFEKQEAIALRQLQLDNHDQYKKALRDWQKKNPDATADEIYTEGRKLLVHFIKSPEELREEDKKRFTVYPKVDREKYPEIVEAAKKVVKGEKPKMKIGDIPIPKDKREFINKLRELEKIDPGLGAEYYNKYLDKFW